MIDRRSELNRVRKFWEYRRIGVLTTFQRKMAWKAERRATHGMQMGQKLASIYRSRVSSRRIIISRNWSRENSLLVSRTDALVFYSVVIVRCGEGEREREISDEISQDLEIWFQLIGTEMEKYSSSSFRFEMYSFIPKVRISKYLTTRRFVR